MEETACFVALTLELSKCLNIIIKQNLNLKVILPIVKNNLLCT